MNQITPVEKAVLRCLADGMQSKEIAAHLDRKTATVEGYIRTLFVKMNARSRAHLVALAIGAQHIDDPSLT
jgi:DNA-binding CsgD family transcriptional regulator